MTAVQATNILVYVYISTNETVDEMSETTRLDESPAHARHSVNSTRSRLSSGHKYDTTTI